MKQPHKKSLLELAREGITQADIDDVLKKSWEIYPILHEILGITHYHIKQWSGAYLHTQLSDGCILEQKDQVRYQVIYMDCNALAVKQSEQVKISFRASLYGNYALVQIPRYLDSIPKGVITHHE